MSGIFFPPQGARGALRRQEQVSDLKMHENPETRRAPGSHRRTATPVRFHPQHAKLSAGEGLHAERFYEFIGRERTQDEVVQRLRFYLQALRPPAVGALQVACSDEAEEDAHSAFQRGFVRYLLPAMHFADRAAFSTRGLGGRYEWGSVAIAEDHFSLARGAEDWKVLVVKVNAHVSVEDAAGSRRFGKMARYGGESTYCGALHALLAGTPAPFGEKLAGDFAFEGEDRLAPLRDPGTVDPELAPLYAAVVSARQQARRAMLDVQDHTVATPTLYLVVPCVSLNRAGHDSELVVGVYTADRRDGGAHDEWCGLGDDPAGYSLGDEGGRLLLTDPASSMPRGARNHRELVLSAWRKRDRGSEGEEPRLAAAVDEARAERAAGRPLKKILVATLLGLAFEVAPIPAALVLFGEGLLGIHHAHRAHRLVRKAAGDADARAMLRDIQAQVEQLPPDSSQHVVDLLLAEYGGPGAR